MSSLPARSVALSRVIPLSPVLLTAMVLAFAAAGVALLADVDPLLDEANHYARIKAIRDGTPLTIHPSCCIPTYHNLLGYASKAIGIDTVAGTRLLSLLLSLLSIPIAFRIARKLDPEWAALTTAQLFCLPVLLPFFFLMYTDALALFFVLLAVMLVLDGYMMSAAAASIGAVMVRQTHVIWMGFVFLLPYVRTHGLRVNVSAIREHLRRGWLFLAGFAAFAGFIVVNRGVAIGDSEHHPAFRFHPDNVWFALFVVGVIFLPLHVANLPRIGKLLRARPWWMLIVAAAFYLFWFGTRFDHPYNGWDYCLHNKVLNQMRGSDALRALFFVGVAGTALSLVVTPLKETSFSLVYPLAILSLIPSWLVEPRYVLPALSLFVLFRARRSAAVEWANLAWSLLLSAVLLEGIARRAYFL